MKKLEHFILLIIFSMNSKYKDNYWKYIEIMLVFSVAQQSVAD